MRRLPFDTSVFVHALGREHPHREPCRAPDRGFDGIAGLERIDPAVAEAVARLSAG